MLYLHSPISARNPISHVALWRQLAESNDQVEILHQITIRDRRNILYPTECRVERRVALFTFKQGPGWKESFDNASGFGLECMLKHP